MIEVPSAAMLVGALAREADSSAWAPTTWCSTCSRQIAKTRQHPGLPAAASGGLRLIHSLAWAPHDAGRELTICGEMAGNPALSALLIGLGLRSFSVAPGQTLEVKGAICGTTIEAARALAEEALTLPSIAEIEALLRPG